MANKKINQLVLKTTIQSTDLFPLGDATTGQLYKKTIAELQAAIGGAVISVNGLVGTVVLDTDDIQELASPTNKYFTDARARAAISLTTTGSSGASTYSSSTGVLNVPTYTLAGLGGITASFLSGGTGITYNSSTGVISYSGTVFTDASIRALVSAGTGLSYNSSTGVFTNSITQYTDALARAAISGTAPITYNSTTGAIGITQATTSTNGFLSSTDWNTFNGKQSALTLGNFTEATSSVLTITGGTGAIVGSGLSVQVKQATTSVSGFLSSTDWNTFNGKQNTITNPVTGTSTSGYVTFWNGTSTISGDAAHFWDNTNKRLGINTSSPSSQIHIAGGADSFFTDGIRISRQSTLGQYVLVNYAGGSANLIATDTVGSNPIITFNTSVNGSSVIERMRITSAGNVGIATSSPLYKLDINGNTLLRGWSSMAKGTPFAWNVITSTYIDSGYGAAINQETSDGRIAFYTAASGTAGGAVSFSERMAITSAGLVGIGMTPTGKFHVVLPAFDNEDTDSQQAIFGSGTSGHGVRIGYSSSSNYGVINALKPGVAWSNMILQSGGGNVMIGTYTNNGERLYVSGSIRATGSITANSDARLKKNIERIENALEKVGQISGYTYNTIYDEDRHAGVIAQEIDKVLPEIVNKGNDGLMGVEYGNISALLIEAIKDLKKDNESLRAIVEGLRK